MHVPLTALHWTVTVRSWWCGPLKRIIIENCRRGMSVIHTFSVVQKRTFRCIKNDDNNHVIRGCFALHSAVQPIGHGVGGTAVWELPPGQPWANQPTNNYRPGLERTETLHHYIYYYFYFGGWWTVNVVILLSVVPGMLLPLFGWSKTI